MAILNDTLVNGTLNVNGSIKGSLIGNATTATTATNYSPSGDIANALAAKIGKVASPTANNLAALVSDGTLIDSGAQSASISDYFTIDYGSSTYTYDELLNIVTVDDHKILRIRVPFTGCWGSSSYGRGDYIYADYAYTDSTSNIIWCTSQLFVPLYNAGEQCYVWVSIAKDASTGSCVWKCDDDYFKLNSGSVSNDMLANGCITAGKLSDALLPSDIGAAASSHSHGNLLNDGTLLAGSSAITTGYVLAVVEKDDGDYSGKLFKSSIAFDTGDSYVNYALTKQGLFKEFLPASMISTSYLPLAGTASNGVMSTGSQALSGNKVIFASAIDICNTDSSSDGTSNLRVIKSGYSATDSTTWWSTAHDRFNIFYDSSGKRGIWDSVINDDILYASASDSSFTFNGNALTATKLSGVQNMSSSASSFNYAKLMVLTLASNSNTIGGVSLITIRDVSNQAFRTFHVFYDFRRNSSGTCNLRSWTDELEFTNVTSYIGNVKLYKYIDSSKYQCTIYAYWEKSISNIFIANNPIYQRSTGTSTIYNGADLISSDDFPAATQLEYYRYLKSGNCTAIGSSSTPVYVDADGKVTACTYSLSVGAYGSAANTIYFV